MPKSIRRFMDQVRALTGRRVPLKTKELIEELNPVLRVGDLTTSGPTVRKLFHRLDGWMVRRIPSKWAAPNVGAGSLELSRVLFYCFSSRWHIDSSHRDRATFTSRSLRILRLALLQPSKRHSLPAGLLVYDDAGRQHLQRPACFTQTPPRGPTALSDRDGRRPGPGRPQTGACPRSGPHAAHPRQPRLCQRSQATSTHWPLSEMRLPVCVRRRHELITSSSRSGFCPHRRLERVDVFSVHQFRTAHRGRDNFRIREAYACRTASIPSEGSGSGSTSPPE